MKDSISIYDKSYGLIRLKKKLERCEKQLAEMKAMDKSPYGYENMGRLEEAIYIYKEMIAYWED